MALENCFQMSTVFTTRSGGPQYHHPFSSVEKQHLPTCKALTKPILSFALSFSLKAKPRIPRTACKAGEAVDAVKPVTDSTWETLVIASENPVLVDFWAPWCGPCKMIEPLIDDLAKEYAGKISCYKVNTDECPNIATKYGIRSIPTVLFFKNGEKKEGIIGAVQKQTLADTIDKYVE